ncbi:SDR family oxidoreductase [Solicola sp. PLA-1-18]|uniref:SDR family oxidoreductase n=1 Tax=Solicola sp. PLA-1-18 TaxID=3380532 RepID=UPI003B78842F
MSEVRDAGVVVTGAAGGIGRAIAERLVAEGARVVVNDLDADRLAATAAEIGAHPVPGDAASEDGVAALVGAAREQLGAVDVWFANAGVATEGGPEATEHDWALSFEVNVMAHVRASRLLLPDWLERGSGRFVSTASAAGLLMMLGSAPYTVSKHAAVGYASWLRATYAHRGVVVQCLCPQGVNTDMLAATGRAGEVTLSEGAVEPSVVADVVVQALADDRFLVLPHPEVEQYFQARAADGDRWLGGMNKLQRRIES